MGILAVGMPSWKRGVGSQLLGVLCYVWFFGSFFLFFAFLHFEQFMRVVVQDRQRGGEYWLARLASADPLANKVQKSELQASETTLVLQFRSTSSPVALCPIAALCSANHQRPGTGSACATPRADQHSARSYPYCLTCLAWRRSSRIGSDGQHAPSTGRCLN